MLKCQIPRSLVPKKPTTATKCILQTISIAVAVASPLPLPLLHRHRPLVSQLMPNLNVIPLNTELRGGVYACHGSC